MTVAAEPKRSRLGLLLEQEGKLVQQIDALNVALSEYPGAEDEARVDALREKPTQRPGATLNSPVQKIRDKAEKDRRDAETAESDLRAVRRLIAEEMAKRGDQLLVDIRRRQKRFREDEAALYRQAGKKMADLVGLHGRLLELAAEHDGYLYAQAEKIEPEYRETLWQDEPVLLVSPLAVTVQAFVRLLVNACVDPHGNGYQDGGNPLDDRRALVGLVPDLRSTAPKPELSGRIPTRKE